jgi:type III secretory pathway lipoprotein EscJ
MRKYIILYILLLLLVSCQQLVQVSDSSHISEEEVVKVLNDNGVNIVKAELQENVFGTKLKNVKPFYVHEQDFDSQSIPFEKEIQEALDSLSEG